MTQARAILWAQWRTAFNFYPRGSVAWTAIIGFFWYGFWIVAAVAASRLTALPENVHLLRVALPGTLLIALLYWQVVPLLMAATGASLELRKLQAYPIPVSQLFSIEVLLRLTAGIEMVLVLSGIAIGLIVNPAIRWWAALAILVYIVFNLFLAVGLRDLLLRMMARRRFREVIIFLLVMCSALPQLCSSSLFSSSSDVSAAGRASRFHMCSTPRQGGAPSPKAVSKTRSKSARCSGAASKRSSANRR